MEEQTVSEPSGAKPTRASPPRQLEGAPAGTAEFVICDHTIERCFEEGKTELGMAHYEVRKYPGWHHHMLTTMLAHFFLWRLKVRLGKKSPGAHGVAVADGIGGGLAPAHVYD
jgi:SRSO17 transposase